VRVKMMFATLMIVACPALARGTSQKVEVPIAHVFVPSKGYDDNDNVEVVLDGELPNSCYTVDLSQVMKDAGNAKILDAKQFAMKRSDGVCAHVETLSGDAKLPVPYTLEARIGQLDAGQYTVKFKSLENTSAQREFNVAVAPAPLVDSLPYASVSGIHMSDVYSSDQEVKGSLDGQITSTCMSLSQKLDVRRLGDVFVIRPTTNNSLDFRCFQLMRPFGIGFNFGKLSEGRYLVHVRSRNGKALYRAFSIVSPSAFEAPAQP
jgi:hypothetical protein